MNILEDSIRESEAAEAVPEFPEVSEQEEASESSGLSIDFSFLKTPTGEGSIEDYLQHPLNRNGSRGVAQMLRGFTGFAGSLNLAIIDITLGAFETLKEKRGLNNAEV